MSLRELTIPTRGGLLGLTSVDICTTFVSLGGIANAARTAQGRQDHFRTRPAYSRGEAITCFSCSAPKVYTVLTGARFERYRTLDRKFPASIIESLYATTNNGLLVGFRDPGASLIQNGEVVSFAVGDGQQMGVPSFNYRLKRVAMADHWAQTAARELGSGKSMAYGSPKHFVQH